MVNKCCVPACDSNYKRKGEEKKYVSVFGFPDNEQLREKWIRKIPRQNLIVTKNSKVCEKHFQESDIIKFDILPGKGEEPDIKVPRSKFSLKEGAFPSIFLNLPSYLSSSTTTTRESPRSKRRRYENREQDELSDILEGDKITSFENFSENIQDFLDRLTGKKFEWNTKEDNLVIYKIDFDNENKGPTIKFSAVIDSNMDIKLWSNHIPVISKDLAWIIADNKLERWSQLENILSHFELNHASEHSILDPAVRSLVESKCSSEGLDSPGMTRQSVRSLLHDQVSALINQTLPEEELILKLRSILDYAQPNALASLHKFQNVFNRKWAGDTQPFTSLQNDFQKLNLAQVSKDLRCFVISLNASERILKSRLDSASYIWSSTQAQILLSHTYVSSVNAGLKEIEAEVHQCLENINRLMLILNEFKSKLHNKCPDKPGTDADRLSAVKLEKADGYFHDETIGTDTIKIKEELNDDVHEFSENVVERTVKVEQEAEDEPYLYDQTSTTSAAEQDDHHRNTCHGENDIDLDMSVTLEPYGELVAQDREIVPTVFKRQFASKSTAKKENPGPKQSTTSSFKPAVTPPVKKGKRKIESSAVVPSSKRTRTNGFLHECKVCDARFRWKYELASHSGVHSDSNRHRCKQCNAGFSELSILQKHEKICTK